MFIVHFIIIGTLMYFIMKYIEKKVHIPDETQWRNSDPAFLALCCRRSGQNLTEIFRIAADRHGINIDNSVLRKDISLYLRHTKTPFYVDSFITEGRKELLKDENE